MAKTCFNRCIALFLFKVFYAKIGLMVKEKQPNFDSLQKLVNQLIDKCEAERNKALQAQKTVEVLERELREKMEKNADLEKQLEAGMVANTAGGNQNTDQMKRHVSELIQEVDRCIALLND